MTEHQSSRTLVKSAPELWAECSDAASLARHLGAFGEIRITKLEPETAVAWEGAAASGTVKLETSGWGTRVTLTVKEEGAPPPPRPDPAPVVEAVPEPEAAVEEPEAAVDEPEAAVDELEPEPVAVETLEPAALSIDAPEPVVIEGAPRLGMFARFRGALRRRGAPVIEPDAPEPEGAEPEPVAVAEPDPPPEPEPVAVAEPDPAPEPKTTPVPASEPAAVAEPSRPSGEDALVAALDSLGMAHHRPYSRS
jgi:hypothetical protein